MQITSNSKTLSATIGKTERTNIQTNFTEKISKEEAKQIRTTIRNNANDFALKSVNIEGTLVSKRVDMDQAYQDFQSFLKEINYEGKLISTLSISEATALVSEDGFFGIKKTAQRMANFVVSGAGGNEDLFRAGREGMLQGFKDAQAMWGGKLPDISQETMKKAIELVDKKMYDLGFSILNQKA